MPFSTLDGIRRGVESAKTLRRVHEYRASEEIGYAHDSAGLPILVSHRPIPTAIDLDRQTSSKLLVADGKGAIVLYNFGDYDNVPRDTGLAIKPVAKGRWPQTSDSIGRYDDNSINSVSWYSVDNYIFFTASSNSNLCVWDTSTLQVVKSFSTGSVLYENRPSQSQSQSPMVATGVKNGMIRICDLRVCSFVMGVQAHVDAVYGIDWSPLDDSIVASSSADKNIKLWDIRYFRNPLALFSRSEDSHTPHIHPHSDSVTCIRFTTNGVHLISSGADDTVRKWDAFSCKETNTAYPNPSNTFVRNTRFALSHKSNILYHQSGNNLGVYDVNTGELLKKLKCSHDVIHTISSSYDGHQYIFTSGSDNSVIGWKTSLHKLGLKPKPERKSLPRYFI